MLGYELTGRVGECTTTIDNQIPTVWRGGCKKDSVMDEFVEGVLSLPIGDRPLVHALSPMLGSRPQCVYNS